MATYGQLLVDVGGGVVDRRKQSKQQDGATLIIGLGGTGTDAVIKIKKEVYKQLQPDDLDSPIPRYGAIKYLVIDSDATKIAKQNGLASDIDKANEFFDISNTSIKTTFEAKKVLEGRRDLDWLDYDHIHPDDASAGAGGIRQVGRFLLVDKALPLYDKLKTIMTSALKEAKGSKINVHIFAGISGGTGSGTFIDMCYLVKEALRELGHSEDRVSGYFFLPDVNLSVPEVSADSLKSGYIKVNGYAALQELDYCMNFGRNKDSFKMNYGFKQIENAKKPVDLCYLISTTDTSGNVVKNGYQYAMGVVADYVLNFLAKVELPAGVEPGLDSGLTLDGHIANLVTEKDGIAVQYGAALDYNVLGASVAEMPLTEIATYLGARLFEKYRSIYTFAPTENHLREFVVNSQFTYDDIRNQLCTKCFPRCNFPANFTYDLFKARGTQPFVEFIDNQFCSPNIGAIEENGRVMTEKLGDYNVEQQPASLIGRTYKNLFDHYVITMQFGPFFAKRLIFGNNNPNLIRYVDGLIAQNTENKSAELRQEDIRKNDINNAEAALRNAGFLNGSKRTEEYKAALNNWYVHLYRLDVYNKLDEVLREWKRQLTELDDNFFAVLTTVLDTLICTFEENASVLSAGVKDDNAYSWKILSVPDVQEELDEIIKKIDVEKTLYDLMVAMFENCKLWMSQEAGEITKLVTSFVLKEFEEAARKTMTDYLKIKYDTTDDTILAQRIKTDILQDKLWDKSSPLFWQNNMYKSNYAIHSTLTIPYDASEIKNAANGFKNDVGEVTIRESGITDKLSVMRFYSGLPLFSYQAIQELERAYENDNRPGRHLYERGEVNWTKMLPSPIPESFEITLPIERISNKNKALLEKFDAAEKLGIIVDDGFNHFEINVTEPLDVAALEAKVASLGENRGAYVEMLEQLQQMKSNLKVIKAERIESHKTNSGAERQVARDYYLLSPVLNKLVEDELTKISTLEALLAKVEATMNILKDQDSILRDFLNAIFSGTITYGKKVVYNYEEFGMPKSIDLQNMDMPYGDSGAFCAFETFKSLDAAIVEKISKETKKRMQDDDDTPLREAVASLDETMPRRIASYYSIYENDVKRKEIEEFYDKFMKQLQTFKNQNQL